MDLNQSLHLELTVDTSDDGQIAAADPPLLPRQSIVPAVFAQEAAEAEKLAGFPFAELPGNVPIGTVLMWWGDVDKIPSGFELCTGGSPVTSGAVISTKPDLRDRFVKAPPDGIVARTDLAQGGANTIPARVTDGHPLTLEEMPRHTHVINDNGHHHQVFRDGSYLTGPGRGGPVRAELRKSQSNAH